MAPALGSPGGDALVCAAAFAVYVAFYAAGRWAVERRYRAALVAASSTPSSSKTADVAPLAEAARRERMRARSWLLSLLVSGGLSAASLVYGPPVLAAAFAGEPVYPLLLVPDAGGRVVTLCFVTFLVADILVGLVDYRAQLDLLTGWVHHTVYFVTLVWFLSLRMDSAFPSFTPCELPTFLLALGSVHKPWRLDLPMGVLFFLTRILYFGGLVAAIWLAEGPLAVRPWLGAALFALHSFWMRGWLRSYAKLRRARREAAAAAAASAAAAGVKKAA
jgi:hypothetical protein